MDTNLLTFWYEWVLLTSKNVLCYISKIRFIVHFIVLFSCCIMGRLQFSVVECCAMQGPLACYHITVHWPCAGTISGQCCTVIQLLQSAEHIEHYIIRKILKSLSLVGRHEGIMFKWCPMDS